MGSRVKSAIATALIQGGLAYALIVGLAMTIPDKQRGKISVVDIVPERPAPPPPPRALPPLPQLPKARAVTGLAQVQPVKPLDWAGSSALQREAAFIEIRKWQQDNIPEGERRLTGWREALPQGSGPGRVTRLQPPNLTTHTLYWPAKWAKGPLPVIAWGNGQGGMCANSSLPYAAFLSEIASHGYFVVAVGNDDIDYPQPEGLEILADGRPIRTQASALRKAVDWAIAENGRGGSPYAGRVDTSRIAYMGHGCGGGQAIAAAADPRTTTAVVLNTAASFRADPGEAHKPPLAHFEGGQDDDAVLEAGAANFAAARAAGWPMYKAALNGMGHEAAYPGPDRRWSKAVLAWLDWQLKGDAGAARTLDGLSRNGWSRIDATGIALAPAP